MAGVIFTGKAAFEFKNSAAKATGEVIYLETRRTSSSGNYIYYPKVQFTTESGQTVHFTDSFGSNPAGFDVGEKVAVLYVPGNPNDAKLDSFFNLYFVPFLLSIFGTVFGGIGGGMIAHKIYRRRLLARLKLSGQRISAKVIEVGYDTTFHVNGRSPFRIIAQWQNPLDSHVHVFKSEHIWYDPSQFISDNQSIAVWIDAKDPKYYAVDTEFLPKQAA